MSDHIQSDIADGILTFSFNRPEKKNAITAAMYAEAARILHDAEQNAAVRVVVLTGVGNAFTAGNDLKDFLENPPVDSEAPVFRFMAAVVALTKPVIAAVAGVAVGIGTTVLLHCDLIYAAPEARFQLPFVNLGLVPEFASSLLLPHIMGYQRAAELLLLGEPFSAEDARNHGLVTAVVPAAELMATVQVKAKILAAKPTASLRATKALLRGEDGAITARIQKEVMLFSAHLKSDAFKEAAAAFLEKRPPDFSKLS
jgi:enoyl-CoA hydratase/carnithine racemase